MEQFKIAKWGNSLAVRLPNRMVKAMGLKEGGFLPAEVLLGSAAIRATLLAEREASRISREEAMAEIREARKLFPKHLKPEDWKIDRNDPGLRG